MSMVNYVVQHNNGDPSRVYVTGASSGAMMTNVLLGDYPDVFKAGAAFMGVPFACFATTDGSKLEQRLRQRQLIKTAAAVGRPRPRRVPGLQRRRAPGCSCGTAPTDTTLRYPNFGEEIKQWTNVLRA